MICKGCGHDKKLVKSHIIPAAFFRDLKDGEDHLKLVSGGQIGVAKRSRTGIYDKSILCNDCEDKFQVLDSYAATTLIERRSLEPVTNGIHTAGYTVNGVDCDLLKRFFVGVLWRASISTNEFFAKVNLGPLEELAKRIAWAETPSAEDEFSYALGLFDDEGTLSKVILDPHPERFNDIRYYRFYLAGYVLYIKASSRSTPKTFKNLIPKENKLIIISRGQIEKSKEYSVMLNGVRGNENA
jgi:hypothetical protein